MLPGVRFRSRQSGERISRNPGLGGSMWYSTGALPYELPKRQRKRGRGRSPPLRRRSTSISTTLRVTISRHGEMHFSYRHAQQGCPRPVSGHRSHCIDECDHATSRSHGRRQERPWAAEWDSLSPICDRPSLRRTLLGEGHFFCHIPKIFKHRTQRICEVLTFNQYRDLLFFER